MCLLLCRQSLFRAESQSSFVSNLLISFLFSSLPTGCIALSIQNYPPLLFQAFPLLPLAVILIREMTSLFIFLPHAMLRIPYTMLDNFFWNMLLLQVTYGMHSDIITNCLTLPVLLCGCED